MNDRSQDRFDEAFKSWAKQSPPTPGDEAARQVMARLPERRSLMWSAGSQLRLAAAAAGLALVLVVSWATLPQSPDPVALAQEVSLPPLQENVVLLWLDDQTPLYLTLAPPATKGGPQ